MKKILIKFFIIFILSLCFFEANSFDISTLGTINSSVIDKVGVLNSTEKQNLETKIQEIRQKYTAEIFLVIIPSTDGEEISQVGTQIGQDIGAGKSDKDNGVVILIAINDKSWNISTGYGVEGVLPDLLTNRIGEKNFILFRDLKYFDGIYGALTDIDKYLSGDKSIISTQKEKNINYDKIIIFIIIFLITIGFILGSILRSTLKQKKYSKFFLLLGIFNIISLPIIYYFIKDITATVIYNILLWLMILFIDGSGNGKSGSSGGSSSGGGGGGGGFGGFGGGSFGGGGSSGKW